MYKCCRLILHGLCFYPSELVVCCYSPVDQINCEKPLILADKYKGEIIPKDELFAKIGANVQSFKEGNIIHECENCFQLEEADWDEGQYIDFITITHYSCCNADCVYCSNNLTPEERTNEKYNVLPFLRYLKEEGILKKGCELHIGGGEFTIYKESEDILREFCINNYAKMYVATNAIRFSQPLADALNSGSTYAVVSLDCGSRETFKRIKRVDAFEKVISNLEKYAQTPKAQSNITLKYIIIPSFNDNMEEFKKFIDIAKRFKVEQIRIDIEARYARMKNHKIHLHYIKLAKEMNDYASKEGFSSQLYSFMDQCLLPENLKRNKIADYLSYYKLRYFDNKLKKLYTNYKYGKD